MFVIKNPHMQQKLEVWAPKYDSTSLTQDYGEQVVLIHKGKVFHGESEYILVEFTKAKHLVGLRFAIKRDYAKKHATGTNKKAAMLEIPMSHFKAWESALEERERMRDRIESFGWWSPAHE
jgi:hypothetical protein